MESSVKKIPDTSALENDVSSSVPRTPRVCGGIEQAPDDDHPPVPFEAEEVASRGDEDLQKDKSDGSKIVGPEEINTCDSAPLPPGEVARIHEEGQEKTQKFQDVGIISELTSNLRRMEQIDDSAAPVPMGQDMPFSRKDSAYWDKQENRDKSVTSISSNRSELSIEFLTQVTPPSSSHPSTTSDLIRTETPPDADADADADADSPEETSQETPPMFLELEATLVTDEPPATIYDAVVVRQGDDGASPTPPEPFWKRHLKFVVGGCSLLFLAVAASIGAVVATLLNRGGNEAAPSEPQLITTPTPDDQSSSTISTSPSNLDGAGSSFDSETQSTSTSFPTSPPTSLSSFNLYSWGHPKSYEEGLDNYITVPTPLDESVVDASAGSVYSIILLPNGTARSEGYIDNKNGYDYGQLGLFDVTLGYNPYRDISQVFDSDHGGISNAPPFKRVFAGQWHSLFIDEDGHAWTTGENTDGQLCIGDDKHRMIPHKVPIEGRVVDAAVGGGYSWGFTVLLHENGTVYGCGSNAEGRLGLRKDVTSVNWPTKIEGLGFVENVSVGLGHSLFLSSYGLYVTGHNYYGQLCLDTGWDDVNTPVAITDIDQNEVSSIGAGRESTYILFNNGTVVACGRNTYGSLGDGTNDLRKIRTITLTPTPVKKLGVGPVSYSSFFIDQEGVVYATGSNDFGKLGVQDQGGSYNEPIMVHFGEDAVVKHISTGRPQTLAIVETKNK